MTDTGPPTEGAVAPNSHLKMDVAVYFPGHEQRFPAQKPLSLHWAGHQSGRSYELNRAQRPRVYYDPKRHPDLFVANNDGAPVAPLPMLELNGDLEDPNHGWIQRAEPGSPANRPGPSLPS